MISADQRSRYLRKNITDLANLLVPRLEIIKRLHVNHRLVYRILGPSATRGAAAASLTGLRILEEKGILESLHRKRDAKGRLLPNET